MLEAISGAALLQLSSSQQLRGQTASSPLLLQQSQLGKRGRGNLNFTYRGREWHSTPMFKREETVDISPTTIVCYGYKYPVCICFISFCPSHRWQSSVANQSPLKTHLLLFPYPITTPFPCFPNLSLSLDWAISFDFAPTCHICPLLCEYVLLWCMTVCLLVGKVGTKPSRPWEYITRRKTLSKYPS